MTVAEGRPATRDPSFIRAGGGIQVRRRLILQILAALVTASLAVFAAGLAVSAHARNHQRAELTGQGVRVQATVTDCVAISDGVGQAIQGYTCHGRYSLGGETLPAVIHGPDLRRPTGSTVEAVAVPGDPSLLTAVGSVRQPEGWWGAYGATAVLAVLAALVLAAATVLSFRTRRRAEVGADAPAQPAGPTGPTPAC